MGRFFSLLPFSFPFLVALAIVCSNAQLIPTEVFGYHPNGREGSCPVQECPDRCSFRCSATSHRKPCMFYCIKCCTQCLCVPSGTAGNKQECPCYNNWKTQDGKPKCP